jgi:hypothetical protein
MNRRRPPGEAMAEKRTKKRDKALRKGQDIDALFSRSLKKKPGLFPSFRKDPSRRRLRIRSRS